MEEFAGWIASEFDKEIPAIDQALAGVTGGSGGERQRQREGRFQAKLRAFFESHNIDDAKITLAIIKFYLDGRVGPENFDFPQQIASFWQGTKNNRPLNTMAQQSYGGPLHRCLDAAPPLTDAFPDYAWVLTISFTLDKPFFSRDDGEFHVHDNPICRERILQLPMIKPSTWKGNLRAAADLLGTVTVSDQVITDLFGNDHNEQEHFNRGRLFFFPTFFEKAGIEVITPLKRTTRTPERGPITFEVVPKDQQGKFHLLYLPPWMGSEKERLGKIRDEYDAIPHILKGALRTYGFSAKKADGWGCIKEPFPGSTVKIKKETLPEKPFKTFAELTDIFMQLRPPQVEE